MSASVTRSLARIVADALADYEVRTSSVDAEGPLERPCAVVVKASTTSSPRGPAFAEQAARYSVVTYCQPGVTAYAAEHEAERCADALELAFLTGRVALYDYSSTARFAPGPATPAGVARITDLAVQHFADTDGLFTVACDFACRWTPLVKARPSGPIVAAVTGRKAA